MHVAVLHDVLLAFRPDDALFLRAFPAAVRDELIVAHRLGANEAALEIGVNHARCLRRGVAAMNRPRADFLLAGREVRLQSEQVVAGANEPIETGRLEAERREKLRPILRRQLGQLRFDLGGEGNDLRVLAARGDRRAKRLDVCAFRAGQLRIGDVRRVEDRLERSAARAARASRAPRATASPPTGPCPR